jgi:hypothetical protein
VQLTDFENAAYVCFVVLLSRVIISFRLTFLVPISKVNENMKRAQQHDAVLKQKFWFRKGLNTCNTPPDTVWGEFGVCKSELRTQDTRRTPRLHHQLHLTPPLITAGAWAVRVKRNLSR